MTILLNRQRIDGMILLRRLIPIYVILCLFATAAAQEIDMDNALDRVFEDRPDLPWVIDADTLRFDSTLQQYIAEGNVVISKAGRELRADFVRFDQANMRAFASGNVELILVGQRLEAGSIDLDLEKQTGLLTDGYLFIEKDNFHLRGKSIRKIGESTYILEQASLTTCDGAPPDWSVHTRKLKVTVDEYATGRGATFRARNTGVLWSPYIAFPVKTKRESGLLIPEFGLSNRKGFFINQPYFWAINDHTDATFYANLMTQRGLKLGGEYRYLLSEQTKGTWMFDFLQDSKIDDGTGDSSKRWGFEGDGILRPNRDRYWFRGSHYQPVPLGFFSRLDLDIVSDQDYLNEFKKGYSGFDDTRAFFLEAFGRELDDCTDRVRLNRLNLNRNWPKYSVDIDFRWFDDVVKRRSGEENDTVQRLPFIGFSGLKQPIPKTIFFWDFSSEYDYFYRMDGDRGHRIDANPRLYLPLKLKNYLAFEPSAGIRGTYWNVNPDSSGAIPGDQRDTFSRALYDLRAEMSTDFFRVFRSEIGSIDRLKHGLRPQILYEYIPDVDQEELPEFDALDRIDERNLVTYSLINTLTSRRLKPIPPNQPNIPRYNYAEVLRFELGQSYDINEATRNDLQPGEERRPFGPILADLDLALTQLLTVDAIAAWDVYDKKFDSGNIYFTFYTRRRDRLGIDYFYTRDRNESVSLDFLINLTSSLATTFEYEQNIREDRWLKTFIGFQYTSQCWSTEIVYRSEPNNNSIQFLINLHGLGGLGGSGSIP